MSRRVAKPLSEFGGFGIFLFVGCLLNLVSIAYADGWYLEYSCSTFGDGTPLENFHGNAKLRQCPGVDGITLRTNSCSDPYLVVGQTSAGEYLLFELSFKPPQHNQAKICRVIAGLGDPQNQDSLLAGASSSNQAGCTGLLLKVGESFDIIGQSFQNQNGVTVACRAKVNS
ncbi:MAG: hypothetical protein DCC75_04890 [Proteobacteria bacterium]|nr:MAG: hypothetical protein DCC75_04890 [Pseudomonadota bacterium]